jgi:hypothetical protein
MTISHLVILIHPLVWQHSLEANPRLADDDNAGIYLERERECAARWLAELPRDGEPTLLVQLSNPRFFAEAIRARVGERNACLTWAEPDATPPDAADAQARAAYQHHLHVEIVQRIHSHLRAYDLALDPATVTAEIWGESFEGCAAGYAGAIAHGLGLAMRPVMRFEMTVYDSRFLYGARRWEAIPIIGSDVEAMLFELHDHSFAALYQARLSEQWLDLRPLQVHLDPTMVKVCTKTGHTTWPAQPWRKGDPEIPIPCTVTASDSAWLRGWRTSGDAFRQVVASARIGEAPAGWREYV